MKISHCLIFIVKDKTKYSYENKGYFRTKNQPPKLNAFKAI